MKVRMRIAAAAVVLLAGVACQEETQVVRCDPFGEQTSRIMPTGRTTSLPTGGVTRDGKIGDNDAYLREYGQGLYGSLKDAPDKHHLIRPHVPAWPRNPGAPSTDTAQCITRAAEQIYVNYDLTTGWTEFSVPTDTLPAMARTIPIEHCLITDDPSGWSTVVADEEALGSILLMSNVVRFSNNFISGRITVEPMWQGNRFLGYIGLLHLETPAGDRTEIITTSW